MDFAPSYTLKPKGTFTPEALWERRQLEGRTDLGPFEKRRLAELYEMELKTLSPGSPLYERLREETAYLQAETSPLREEAQKAWQSYQDYARQNRDEPAPRPPIKHRGLKRQYDVAYQLWNQDQNEAALERVDEIRRDATFKDEVGDRDWYAIENLRFRVAVDLGQMPAAEEAYGRLHDLDDCADRTAVAGFLVALHRFAAGNSAGALQVFDKQCDEDKGVSNRLKRMYWRARFLEGTGVKPEDTYRDMMATRVPGYYFYLACSRLNRKVEFAPRVFQTRSFLKKEFSVSGRVNDLLDSAEKRLKAGLKRDAEGFLLQAAARLRKDPDPEDLPALLYVAHLLQASESHVEAMRLYSTVAETIQIPDAPAPVEFDFLDDMFPRPFAPQVDAAARQWGVDSDLIYSLMRQESAFNPEAASVADARGLMQLMPFLARSLADQWGYGLYYSEKYLFHGEENVKLAVVHLRQLQELLPHVALIAASYNAGVQRVSGWWKRWGTLPLDVFVELIPITETRNYVKLVLRNYLYYRAGRSGGVVQSGLIPAELPPYSG